MGIEAHEETSLQKVGDPSVEVLLRKILERLDELERNMKNAFVGGDYDGHRRAHEQFILDMQGRRELRKAIVEQVVRGSVWAAVIFIGAAVWKLLKVKLGLEAS